MQDYLLPKNIGGTVLDISEKSLDKNITVYHANTGVREHIIATLNKKQIVVATDALQAKMLQEDLLEFGLRVDFLPEKEETLYSKYQYNRTNLFNRIKVLKDLATGNVDIITLSPLALLQLVPRKEELLKRCFTINVEDEIKPNDLSIKLIEAGYNRVFNVENEGEFSLKGDVLDVFIGGAEYPCRISFFDEIIESIKEYELVSIKPIRVLSKIEILPLSDILITDEDKDKVIEFLNKNRKNEALSELIDKLLIKLNNNKTDYTLSWIMPLIKGMFNSLFSYIDSSFTIVYDDCNKVKEKLELYLLENKNRVESMIESSSCLAEHRNNLINLNQFLSLQNSHLKLGFMPLQAQNQMFEPDFIFKLQSKPTVKYYLEPQLLINDIKANQSVETLMILCTDNMDRARALQNSLRENDVFINIVNEIPNESGVYLYPSQIRKSITYPRNRFYLVGTEDLLGKKSKISKKKKTVTVIKEGDYVVHERYGIGLCEGVQKETVNGIEKDYIVVGYKDNAKLHIAIEQMDQLTKYTGDKPKISKLGGREFEKVKERVRQSIKKMALNLVELYRKRELTNGFKYSKDTIWQKEFEDEFEFVETPDQLQAIQDVKNDMEQGKVMDRLICGDVGFGKTEVAFRAIFKTIIDSRQAVILAPTTILANQHFKNLQERLAPFKINIKQLSRLQTNQENKETIKEIEEGKVEVVVGTHRILSKDVKFKNLGLLVLDEEQRFGVEQKERLKYIAENVNVLTLSATPIPRTLHMAMSGIRDINLLETPPTNRLPIETYIVEYDDNLVIDAVNREITRGGQVFILYNYVESIDSFSNHLRAILGENVKLTVAHGQMPPELLEERIEDFYNKKADVLVCTTIIENGIDLPNANTLIVYDADKFGLSQLHQLRGRVGRSGKLAHAYFTTKQNKILTSEASQRLVALSEYTDFGSGYQIALKDLQIRGAGNILGREQHGHMEQVGYELYTKMLKEAVNEITTGKVQEDVVTEVKVDIDSYVDENFIPHEDKMALYNKIAKVRTMFDANNLKNEIISMYGRITDGISNMIDLSLIKTLANNIGVTSVIINKKAMGMEFGKENVFKNPQIIKAVSKFNDKCVLTDTTPIRIIFNGKLEEKEKMKLLIDFLQESN